MSRGVTDFLIYLEARAASEEMAAAIGLILEVVTADGRQLIGPFPKNTAAIYEAIERCGEFEDPEAEPNIYRIAPLMPVKSTYLVHPDYRPVAAYAVNNIHGVSGNTPCTCGGIAHYHAIAPHGCDDCSCTEFQRAY